MAEHADATVREVNATSSAAEEPETNETETRVEKHIWRVWMQIDVHAAGAADKVSDVQFVP